MATAAVRATRVTSENRFFLTMAIVMGLLNVAGFSFFAFMGLSSFHAPLYVHLHAFLFFGWVALFVAQNALVAGGSLALHRMLGWIGAGWALAMVVIGTLTTVWMVQKAGVPFFFLPAQFLFMNPLSVLTFAGLLYAGIAKRRETQWHRRLILCAMATIMGPAFGRLLPAPLLMYSMLPAIHIAILTFPIVGIVRDRRRYGKVHPAWLVGIGVILATMVLTETIGRSAIIGSVYDRVVAGAPGAAQPAFAHPPLPPGFPRP